MHIAHELPGRLRLRAHNSLDYRLTPAFAATLEDTLPAVTSVRCNAVAHSLVICYRGGDDTRRQILDQVAETRPALRARPLLESPLQQHRRAALVSASALGIAGLLPAGGRLALSALLVGPVIGRGLLALLSHGLCVEVLDGLALSIALVRREYGTALATLALMHLGEYLEATTSQTSRDMLRRLIVQPPGSAWREDGQGQLVEVPLQALRPDDIVVVGPGEMIPVDGQVVSGAATVSEASLTGEGTPADREAGARVLSGSVVQQGHLRIRAIQVGAATTAARIGQFLESSLDHKPEIQSAAEQLADRRVTWTLALGAITFALTRDPRRLASVFLVDYSCALKLGAPVAIRSALTRASRDGILMKGGRAIEALAGVDTFVFDKTGTLTCGDLTVTDIVPLNGQEPAHLLALLASLEEHATHPVAEAVVSAARDRQLDHVYHETVSFVVAHGLVSEAAGQRIVAGSRHFLEDHEGISFAGQEGLVNRLEDQGRILLFVAIDGIAAGIVGLRDHLRPETAAALGRLRSLGVRSLAVLSGDRLPRVQAMAADLGLDLVFAECHPEDKAGVIRQLQAEGRKVAFIGDGVNDAPALLLADVGIAMPRGADLARATSDVILLQDSLEGVARAREISMQTLELIRSNFRWAALLNSLLFVAAVSGRVSPVTTTIAHNGVTLGTLARAMPGSRRKSRPLLPQQTPRPD